jgi:hypothetical protein
MMSPEWDQGARFYSLQDRGVIKITLSIRS